MGQKEDIKEALHEVLEEHREKYWVDPQQHFLDHEQMKQCRGSRDRWLRNHGFIEGIIENIGTVKKTGIIASVGTVVSALLGLLWYILTHPIKVG